ncbi:sirohydrochlorin chelatase [Cohnella panacarvi]|uniref:sirohydrochlorin chelatase n=1 Tax=Cohnella panacarvi TaxID=400776 RepID=UPI000479BD06|nr:CbiX/SirB N-terminal domain-containing protein [Cohnella panacarvi]
MQSGLLIVSHGSREAGWVSLVDDTVAAVRSAVGGDMLVEAAFLELVEGRLIQDGVDRLEAQGVDRIFSLPLFVSSGSTHVDEIGWALGAYSEPKLETDLPRANVRVPLDYGKPMDDDPEVVDVLLERLREISKVADRESVLLIGHGSKESGFKEAWQQGMASIGERLVSRGGYRGYSGALLQLDEVADRYAELRERNPGGAILVAPLFLSEGYFTSLVIPRELDGLECRYSGYAYMPHPRVADWIVRKAKEWLLKVSE